MLKKWVEAKTQSQDSRNMVALINQGSGERGGFEA